MTVKNAFGEEINYDAAVELMDDDIREQTAYSLAPCTEQEFFNAYCAAHEAAFGETFEPAKENPFY